MVETAMLVALWLMALAATVLNLTHFNEIGLLASTFAVGGLAPVIWLRVKGGVR